jgi:hypothetical protein
MLRRMAARKPATSKTGKSRPRTVRLSHEDERWVDSQTHPRGFSGVISEALRFYREHKDVQRRQLLEAI